MTFKIFTKHNCSWCVKAKEILKENKKTILQEILSQSVEAVNYLKNAGEKKDEK